MSSTQRNPNDPFETLVELTAAAMSGRPPRDFVFAPAGPSILTRFAGFLQYVRLPQMEADVQAANEAEIAEDHETAIVAQRLLQRYY